MDCSYIIILGPLVFVNVNIHVTTDLKEFEENKKQRKMDYAMYMYIVYDSRTEFTDAVYWITNSSDDCSLLTHSLQKNNIIGRYETEN